MPDKETIEHLRDVQAQHASYIIRESEKVKGELSIVSNADDTYDIIVHSGSSAQPTVYESYDKDSLIELLSSRL